VTYNKRDYTPTAYLGHSMLCVTKKAILLLENTPSSSRCHLEHIILCVTKKAILQTLQTQAETLLWLKMRGSRHVKYNIWSVKRKHCASAQLSIRVYIHVCTHNSHITFSVTHPTAMRNFITGKGLHVWVDACVHVYACIYVYDCVDMYWGRVRKKAMHEILSYCLMLLI